VGEKPPQAAKLDRWALPRIICGRNRRLFARGIAAEFSANGRLAEYMYYDMHQVIAAALASPRRER